MDLKWLQSDQANRISRDVRARTLADFKLRYPNADLSKFEAEVTFDENNQVCVEIIYKASPYHWKIVVQSDEKYYSEDMKSGLGFGNFPYQLILSKNEKKPVPAVDFADRVASIGELLDQKTKNLFHPHRIFRNEVS